MSRKIIAQPPYTLLVGHRDKAGFRMQHITTADSNTSHALLEGDITPSEATVTIADNDFTDSATLYVGDFTLTSDVHWVAGGSAAASATALAAAIDNLPDFTASAVGAEITIVGPNSLPEGTCRLEANYSAAITNFTLTPSDGFFAPGGQTIGGIEIF